MGDTVATRSIHDSIDLDVTAGVAFDALVTPSAIRAWWQASRSIVIAKAGGFWAAAWGAEDAPDYVTVARIDVFDRPHRLRLTNYVYAAKGGSLPFEADFVVEFIIASVDNDACTLHVHQRGFPTDPAADAFYEGCVTGWRDTLSGVRAFFDGAVAQT